MNFLALVVLYNVEVQYSPTLLSLGGQKSLADMHVVIRDNSPCRAGSDSISWLSHAFRSFEYCHDGENRPLSRVYNDVIDRYIRKSPCSFDYMILLDHDSVLESDFIDKATSATTANPDISMFLPNVSAGGSIISPAHLYYFKGFYSKRRYSGRVRSRFKTAINSGMVIAAEYLTSEFVGYPPELSFYGTDNWFCERYSERKRWFYVLDSIVIHDLSNLAEETTDTKLWRHREAIHAMRFINSGSRLRNAACAAYALAMSARKVLCYRDWRFLQC